MVNNPRFVYHNKKEMMIYAGTKSQFQPLFSVVFKFTLLIIYQHFFFKKPESNRKKRLTINKRTV